MSRDQSSRKKHHESDEKQHSVDFQTIVWLLNRIPDEKENTDSEDTPTKSNYGHPHPPEPEREVNRRPREQKMARPRDPALISSIESRFDPDEGYQNSSTPFYRNEDL